MAIILQPPAAAAVKRKLNPGLKIRGVRPGFSGATYLVARCVAPGTSGALEPSWDQLFTGSAFSDGTAQWIVTVAPNRPSIPNWDANTDYDQGALIMARTFRLKLDAVKSTAPKMYKPWTKRFRAQPFLVTAPLFHSTQAHVRRTWLSKIWKHVLTAPQRTDWDTFAALIPIVNAKGVEKTVKGFPMFQHCNLGAGLTVNEAPDGTQQFDLSLPSYGDLVNGSLFMWGPASASPNVAIARVNDMGSGRFQTIPDFPVPGPADPSEWFQVVSYWSPLPGGRLIGRNLAAVTLTGTQEYSFVKPYILSDIAGSNPYFSQQGGAPRPWLFGVRIAHWSANFTAPGALQGSGVFCPTWTINSFF